MSQGKGGNFPAQALWEAERLIHGKLPLRSGSPEFSEEKQPTPQGASCGSVRSAPGLLSSPLPPKLVPEAPEGGNAVGIPSLPQTIRTGLHGEGAGIIL